LLITKRCLFTATFFDWKPEGKRPLGRTRRR